MSGWVGEKLRETWALIRRLGPPWHDALVPAGPPKRPRRSSGEALPLPEPEVRHVEAYGRPFKED
jgi:hypothetical protein